MGDSRVGRAPRARRLGETVKTTWYAALVLAAALGLGACGSETPDAASDVGSTTSSSSTTSAVGLAVGTTVDGGALGTRMLEAMVEAGSGTMVIDLGAGGTATGSFVMEQGTMRQHLVMPVEGARMEMVAIDGVLYLKGVPGSKKPWVKIDPKAKDMFSQLVSGMLGDLGNPRQFAEAMEGAQATVVSSSASETTYEVTIDPATLLGHRSGQGALPSMAPVTARYVLDGQDRPVSMTVEVEGQDVSATFGDWGKPVTITAPPAGLVGTFEVPLS